MGRAQRGGNLPLFGCIEVPSARKLRTKPRASIETSNGGFFAKRTSRALDPEDAPEVRPH